MKTLSRVEQEVNRIRLVLQEEAKNLTREQRIERTNSIAKATAQKYGLKFITSTKE